MVGTGFLTTLPCLLLCDIGVAMLLFTSRQNNHDDENDSNNEQVRANNAGESQILPSSIHLTFSSASYGNRWFFIKTHSLMMPWDPDTELAVVVAG